MAGLQAIFNHIDNLELNISNVQEKLSFKTFLKRLNYCFLSRRLDMRSNAAFKTHSVISASMELPSYRDALLRIARFMPRFSILQHFETQESL